MDDIAGATVPAGLERADMKLSSFDHFEAYLDSLGLFSMQLGLERMTVALGRLGLGRPPAVVVHVVGTNGKGSTSGFLDALGRAHGLRTGLYTSPHLVRVRERIRVDGHMLPEKDWLRAANLVLDRCGDIGLTYFELLTVMALELFRQAEVDMIVLEAGLGGTHDATRAVSADLAVMTPVGLDHEAVLGPTLGHIARDKAGALGRCPAVTGLQAGEVLEIFRRAAGSEPLDGLDHCRRGSGFVVDGLRLDAGTLPDHPLYQLENAALAVLAWSTLTRLQGWQFRAGLCTEALGRTYFSGRFRRHGRVLVDGAHNTMGLTALCATLEKRGEHFDVLIFQAMQDKKLDQTVLDRLTRLADEVVVPALPHVDRASRPEELVRRLGRRATAAAGLRQALARPGLILLCGSLYLVGAYYALYPDDLEA